MIHIDPAVPHQIPVTLIPGDGVGPEITTALVRVFSALGDPINWEVVNMGLAAHHEFGDALPTATVESIRRTGIAIKGPIQTPLGQGFRSPLLRLRNEFQLFANIRRARTILTPIHGQHVDMVVVRENTEGLYASQESYVPVGDDPRGIAIATAWNSRQSCKRILEYAYQHAITHGRRKVTVVHKANVLKILSGIFLDTARTLYKEKYTSFFEMEEMIVDTCAMKMAMVPERFDVIVTTNLFGDILSDLAAGVTGGLGMAPGANIGQHTALFEAVHGSAPDIAGRGIANPVALLLSGALLLEYVGKTELANRLRVAIDAVLNKDLVRTPDIGGSASGDSMATAIIRRLT